jgi:hypothetical protein
MASTSTSSASPSHAPGAPRTAVGTAAGIFVATESGNQYAHSDDDDELQKTPLQKKAPIAGAHWMVACRVSSGASDDLADNRNKMVDVMANAAPPM